MDCLYRDVFHREDVAVLRAKIISITCLLGTVAATAFAAPSLSQPGQDIKGQLPKPQAQVEKAAEPVPQASEVKFKLTDVEIDARELKVDAAALEAILAPCVGRETTLTELNTALAQVTAYCRRHGYPASAAYLPAQGQQGWQDHGQSHPRPLWGDQARQP